jgi:GWxTD domain-containing protein
MINLVNGIAETWFGYMASATFQATILALFILGVLRVGRRWPPALRHALLMLALCKFVIPPMFSLPTGLFNRITPRQWSERSPAVKNDLRPVEKITKFNVRQPSAISVKAPKVQSEPELFSLAPAVYKPAFSAQGRLLLLHFLGALLIFALAAVQKIRLHRLGSRAAPAEDPALSETYNELCLSMKLRIRPRLLICSDNHAPITFGAWKPVVILPQALVDTLPLADIRVILGHELAHHRRWDPWLASLQVFVSALWWFNPVYWLLSRSIRSVREDCCDDMVLASGLASRESYCQTLLQAARAAWESNAATRTAFAYLGKAQPLRRRFRRIMSAKSVRAPKLAMAGLLAIFVLGLVLLPGVEPRILAQSAAPAESVEENPIPAPQHSNEAAKAENKLKDDPPFFSPTNPKPADVLMKNLSLNMKMMRVPGRDTQYSYKALEYANKLLSESSDSDFAPIARQYKIKIEETLALGDLEVTQFYIDKGNLIGALARLKAIKDNYPNFSRMNEVDLLVQQAQQMQGSAGSNYYMKWLDEDVVYIIAPDDKNEFLALRTDKERESFIERFWARRDPAFKAEHYRRIAYANEHFGSSVSGWRTERGRIYILYGKPDEIEPHPSGGKRGDVEVGPYEKWRYGHIDGVGDDIEIDFVDLSGTGEYRMGVSGNEKGIVRAGSDSPFQRMNQYFESRGFPSGSGSLQFNVKTDYVQRSAERVLVRITIGLENKDLEFANAQGVNRATVDYYGTVKGSNGRLVAEWEDVIAVEFRESGFSPDKYKQTIYQHIVAMLPGQQYKLDVTVKDANSKKTSFRSLDLNVP